MNNLEQSYSLDDYVAALKRRSRVFFITAIPIVVIAGLMAISLPNEYRSTARISVDLEGSNIQALEPIQVAAYADQYIAELRDRVLSEDNLVQLAADPGVFPQSEDELPISERVRILAGGFFFQLELQPVMTDSGREVDIISGFRTGFSGPDPEFAKDAAAFFANSFLVEDRKSRTERASSTSAFLRQQIAETELQIVEYEQEVADFKVKYACCLPELQELNMSIIQRAERDLEALQPRIRRLEQDRKFLQAQLNEIRQQSVSTNRLAELEREYVRLVANYGPDHPDVVRVRREISAITNIAPQTEGGSELQRLQAELAEAQRKYSDLHPDVVSLKRRIAAISDDQGAGRSVPSPESIDNPRYLQLRAEVNAISTELEELRHREPELRDKIADYENRLMRTPQIESENHALLRKLETARESFDNLQRGLVVAQQTEALESTEIGARIELVRGASAPRSPSGPPRTAILIAGIVFSAVIGTGIVILFELLDSTIRGSKDVIRTIDIIPMTAVPEIQNSTALAASRQKAFFLYLAIGASVIVVAILFVFKLA